MLHPQHKLDYFRRAGWVPEWIETAEALVRDQFNETYKEQVPDVDDDDDDDTGNLSASESNHPKVRLMPVYVTELIASIGIYKHIRQSPSIQAHFPVRGRRITALSQHTNRKCFATSPLVVRETPCVSSTLPYGVGLSLNPWYVSNPTLHFD